MTGSSCKWLFLVIIQNLLAGHVGVLAVCFEPEKEFNVCSHELGIGSVNRGKGFAFGYGSLNDTVKMCRNRWHIKLLDCMRAKVLSQCQFSNEERFYSSIWVFSLDSSRFRKGADYMCQEHSLRVFNSYKDGCLRKQESQANNCAKLKSFTMKQTIKALSNKTSTRYSTLDQYYEYVKITMNDYECRGLRQHLQCLYEVLHMQCPPDAVRLILNYFKEILPPNCHYDYEPMLTRYLQSDYYRRISGGGSDSDGNKAMDGSNPSNNLNLPYQHQNLPADEARTSDRHGMALNRRQSNIATPNSISNPLVYTTVVQIPVLMTTLLLLQFLLLFIL